MQTKTSNTLTGGEALCQALVANGADTLFAIPGIQLDWAVDALAARPEISVYVPRHEQSVSYMADGFARVTGKPGVGMVVPGPGMLNATAGLSTAYACNSPMVFLVGQIHSQAVGKGFGNLHEIPDQPGVLRGLSKSHALVMDTAQIPGAVNSAFASAMEGRRRPATVEIPFDHLMSKTTYDAGDPTVAQPTQIDTKAIEQAAQLLDDADFPVIYIGGGAVDAGGEIMALADRLGAPIVASDNGRGATPDSHSLTFNALAGRPLISVADVVLVIGSRFMDVLAPEPSWPQDGKTFIFLNIDPQDMKEPREAAIAIEGDAAEGAQALSDAVSPREVLSPETALKIKRWARDQIEQTGTLWRYVEAIRSALPDDGIFVNELTQVGYLARIAFECRQPRTLIGPGYQGTLGYGFPTALGASVGGGGRRVFSITGDGGFGWSIQELATAKRYNLPVTLIVFNDGHYGNVRSIQSATFGRNYLTELSNPDFATLAAAFGLEFANVSNPQDLQKVLTESVENDGPMMVEVRVGSMASPWPLLRLRPMGGGSESSYDHLF
ncbi:thiamine pyrophosphate-binding protein [Rhodobacteraceae bacterium D3-12]|nr:thiamine pyrophosphate-binding protein [Rhodobacteraceae bacterium D3-12]